MAIRVTRTARAAMTGAGPDGIVELLKRAYLMELETVANYLAASANLEGIRAREVAQALSDDVGEELAHARRLGRRLHELDAIVPGSLAGGATQESLQPSADQTDVVRVIEGVLDAEEAAIAVYRDLIEETDGYDWVTQDLAVSLLADEEAHRRLFKGFLREYDER
jgi:bacterioferritin